MSSFAHLRYSIVTAHLRYSIVTAHLLVVGFSGAALAQSSEDSLLDELKSADAARAAQIVREMERLWSLSGSTSIDMIFRRGQDAMEEEDFSLAIEHFTAVTDHAPEFAEGYHARATAYYRTGRFGPALSDLGQALALNPNNWDALFGLGMLFGELGEYDKAGRALRMVLDLHPHHEDADRALKSLVNKGIDQEL